jgi:hypothetical protein
MFWEPLDLGFGYEFEARPIGMIVCLYPEVLTLASKVQALEEVVNWIS